MSLDYTLNTAKKKRCRYAYAKFNNSVEELRRLDSMHVKHLDGGPEAYVANFLDIAKNSPVLLVSLHSYPKGDVEVVRDNIQAYSLYWGSGMSVNTIITRLLVSIRLFFHLMVFRPTHVLCWQTQYPLWVSFIASKLLRAHFVPSRHTRFPNEKDSLVRRFTGKIDKFIIRRTSAVICHGPYLKQDLLDIGLSSSRVFEFNWGFQDLVAKHPSTENLEDITEGGSIKVILFIGRIFRLKGVYDLLEACANRLINDSTVKLVYAGDGPDFEDLRTRVKQKSLSNSVVLLGRVRHDILSNFIRQSLVVVTPTQSRFPEGRCMSTIEGLILGVPVIAPDFGPFPYLVRHEENGLLYHPDSIDELEHAVETMLDNTNLYEKLKAGALQTSTILLNPSVRFSQALTSAFNIKNSRKCSGKIEEA